MAESELRGDLEWGTIPRLVQDAARRHPERQAIRDEGTALTYPELADAAARATRAFIATGVDAGDRVSIWAPNVWEWIVAALGAHGAGAALVPLNTRFKGSEAADILGRSRARVLLTVNGFLDTDYVAMLPRRQLPELETIVVLRGDAPDGTVAWADFLATADGVDEAQAGARTDAVAPDDLSDLLFTSGTTGHPKGVMCSHAQSLRAFRVWADVVGLRAGDQYLVVNPFFHSFGYKAGWLAAFMTGATVVPHAVFDPAAVLRRIPEEQVSMLPGPPTLYQSILDHPDRDKYDLSSLRLAVTGAAVIPVSLVLRMRDELGFETVVTGYGLTESCGIATMCRHDDDPETIATTSGRAIPGTEVRVVDDDGKDVGADQPGEVVVRGYNVTAGYLDEPDETARAIDGDGWLHTGDIGVMDDRGYLRITDRKKDMYIVGGFNAYPAEIESQLLRNEKIAQVAVVGVPDERLGEVGMAFVVLRPGQTATEEELVTWCRDQMANYKVPRFVRFVDQLPLNATGKVLKYQLREGARS